ncbi:MAG: peptidoglycan-binding protein [Saprospiraceae bacterium]|nr:peptidoglycan-binding protein [Saprospiraceae bacterium]MDW8484735.1 peptidoglycan-binding protein [Saprospiraceae bacterium]
MSKQCALALWLLMPPFVCAQQFNFPQAQPGRCYVQCLIPDRYEWVSENILSRPEREEQVALPPVFEERRDSYVVRPAHVRLRQIDPQWEEEEVRILIAPAGYKVSPDAYTAVQETIWLQPPVRLFSISEPVWETVEEAIEVEPMHRRVEVLPMRYQWVPQEVEVRPATRRWVRRKVGTGCLEADPENCMVWCLVELPAQTQTIYRQEPIGCDSEDAQDCVRYTIVPAKTVLKTVERLKEPAKAIEHIEPGKYQVVRRWQLRPGRNAPNAPTAAQDEYLVLRRKVLRREAQLKADSVPAVYAPYTRKVLVRDGMAIGQIMPAEYTTVLKRRLVRPGGYWAWREVWCEERIAQLDIRRIQEALKVRGYYSGRIDGTMNAQTRAAIQQFQQENDLPADGNIDLETLQALGVGG